MLSQTHSLGKSGSSAVSGVKGGQCLVYNYVHISSRSHHMHYHPLWAVLNMAERIRLIRSFAENSPKLVKACRKGLFFTRCDAQNFVAAQSGDRRDIYGHIPCINMYYIILESRVSHVKSPARYVSQRSGRSMAQGLAQAIVVS